MKASLLGLLCCPNCRTPLALSDAVEKYEQIESGTLRCSEGHSFPIRGFVPRFVDADDYAQTFSAQRTYVRKHFEHYRRDRSGFSLFEPSTGISDNALRGTSLEVGCGYGRFLDVLQQKGARVVGVELSTDSVELAQDFVGLRPGVDVVQADLFRMPFRHESFDAVFSIGVLHHTPNARAAFEAIAPLAKAGARVSIWVYHPRDKQSANRWRHVAVHLNHRVLYALCVFNQLAFSWVRALPGGWRFNALIPGNMPGKDRPFWLRVLADIDNLSPKHATVHTPEEVIEWFGALGFLDVKALSRLTAVTGVRPGVPS